MAGRASKDLFGRSLAHSKDKSGVCPMQGQFSKSVGKKSRRTSDSIKIFPLGISNAKKQTQECSANLASRSSSLNSRWSPYRCLASFKSTRKKGKGSERIERIAAGLPPEIILLTSTHQGRYSPVLMSRYPNCKIAPSSRHFSKSENASDEEILFIEFASSFGTETATRLATKLRLRFQRPLKALLAMIK